VEGDRVRALTNEAFVDDIQHFEKRHVGRHVVGNVVFKTTGLVGPGLPPNPQIEFHESLFAVARPKPSPATPSLSTFHFLLLLVAALRGMHLVEVERFFMKFGLLPYAFEFPCRNIRIVRIVPKTPPLRCLTFFAEGPSPRLSAVSGVG